MDADQVAPPPGFTLDQPQSTPTPRPGIAQPKVTPPPGFTLDAPKASQQTGIAASAQPQQGGIAHAVGQWWDQVNPMGTIKSAMDSFQSPADLFKSPVYEAGKNLVMSGAEDLGAGNTSRGIRKMISGVIPVIGPSLNKAGEQAEKGDYSGAIGTTLGIATNMGAGEMAKWANSAVGPGIRSGLQSGANRIYRIGAPGMTPELAEFGTTQGIPYTQAGSEKLGGIREAAGQGIGGPVRAAPQTRTQSPGPVATGLEDLKGEFLKRHAPIIEAEKQKFLDEIRTGPPGSAVPNMTPEQAFDLKVKYQDLANRESSTAYSRGVAQSGPELASIKMVPSRLGEGLVAQFPEIKGENITYGLSSELKPIVDHVVELQARKNPLPTALTITSGGIAGTMTGQPVAGLGAAVALEVMRNPAARSRIAIALSKASRVPLPEATARVIGYLNAAAAGAEDRGSQEQP